MSCTRMTTLVFLLLELSLFVLLAHLSRRLKVSCCDHSLSVVVVVIRMSIRPQSLNISSLTTDWILTNLHRNDPWLVLFQSCSNGSSPLHIYGWSGGAKVSCIVCHRGVQLILAYSWARPAILVAGKGREVMFLFLLFLHFHSCSSFFPVSLFHLFCYLFCLFSPFLWETTQNDPQGLTCR